jgi:hypothetical protein
MNITKLAESLKNYDPSHSILIKASNSLIQQQNHIQSLIINRFNWKKKAEGYQKRILLLEEMLRKAQEK